MVKRAAAVVAGAGAVAMFAVLVGLGPGDQVDTDGRSLQVGPDEVVFVLVGAKFCGAHRREGFPEAIEEARAIVRERADASGWRFTATGVALDWSVDDGLEFLQEFGTWDEIVAGRNWFGFGAAIFVWRDLPGEASVPQVLVIHRTVEPLPEAVVFGQDRMLLRLAGVDAIEEWVQSGAPFQVKVTTGG